MVKKLNFWLIQLFAITLPAFVGAQGDFGLEEARSVARLPKNSAQVVAANIIQVVLGFVGIIFLMLIIYGGFQWMIGARSGDKRQVNQAQKTLTAATVGLLIIVTAYSVTYYVTTYIIEANTTTPYIGPPAPTP